jgi:hypothetical protein
METLQSEAIQQYMNCMTPKEMKAYSIAKAHLGDSFQIKKSIGFLAWKKEKAKSEEVKQK